MPEPMSDLVFSVLGALPEGSPNAMLLTEVASITGRTKEEVISALNSCVEQNPPWAKWKRTDDILLDKGWRFAAGRKRGSIGI